MKIISSFVSNSSSSSFILIGTEVSLENVSKELEETDVLWISGESGNDGLDKIILRKDDLGLFEKHKFVLDEGKFYKDFNLSEAYEKVNFGISDVDKSISFLEIDNYVSETLSNFLDNRGYDFANL